MSTKRSTRTEAKMTATNEERPVEEGTDIVAMALAASARYVDAMTQVLKDVGEAHIWAERRLGLMTKETENNEAGKA